jgi:hypothetical protein
MVLFLLACIAISISKLQLFNIAAGVMGIILSYTLSKISINGFLVQPFGDITSADTIITDSVVIYNLPQSYIFVFIGTVTLLITIVNIVSEIKYNIEPDIGDFEL